MRVGLFLVITWVTLVHCSRTTEVPTSQRIEFSSLPDSVLDRAADSLIGLGNELRLRRSYDSAMMFYKAALSLRRARGFDDLQTVEDYSLIGQVQSVQMKSNVAFETLSEAKRLAEKHNAPLSKLVEIYLRMASQKRELLDFASATSLASHALSLVRQREPQNTNLLGRCYRNLGASYHAKRSYSDAVKEYRRALPLVMSEDRAALASLCFNTALAFQQMGQYDSSLIYFDKSLAYGQDGPNQQSDYRSSVYVNKGGIYMKTGQFDSARYFLKGSLQIRKKIWGEKHLLSAGSYDALAGMYDSLGFLDSAMYCHHAALRSAVHNFDDLDPMKNPRPSSDELTMDLVDYLVGKASTAHILSTQDPARFQMTQLASRTYMLADSIYSVLLSNEVFEDAQMSNLDVGRIPYARMMALTADLYARTRESQHLEQAFRIMERSKAIVLKKALTRLESYSDLAVSPELLHEQNRLVEQRSVLVQALVVNQQGGPQRDSISEEIVKVNESYRDLQAQLDAQRSQGVLRENGPAISLEGLKSEMEARRSQWIEYFWSDEIIYVLSIGPSGTDLMTIPVTSELLRSLTQVISDLNQFTEKAATRAGFVELTGNLHSLYNILLEPALKAGGSNSLVISPSGPLLLLPFEALIMSQPSGPEINYKLPYLVNSFNISYQYSSSLIDHQSVKERHGNKLFAVAYSGSDVDSTRSGFADLPGTRTELEAIREIMTNGANLFLTDGQASEQVFKNHAETFNILHLAIHGVSDTSNAMHSRLVFSNAGADDEDGNLYAHELYGLDLRNTDLAVLTACESGLGKFQSGEGMMSIARGFAYAGCPSLVVSLWRISDKATPDIVGNFYLGLSAGNTIDEALTEAKRKYLQETNFINSHPFYWAALLAVGETAAIKALNGNFLMAMILVIVIFALAIAMILRSGRKIERASVRSGHEARRW